MCHGQNSLWTELLAHRQDYVRPFWQSIKLRIRNALDIALHFAPLLCLTKTSSQQLFQKNSQQKALLQLDFLGPTGRTVCKLSLILRSMLITVAQECLYLGTFYDILAFFKLLCVAIILWMNVNVLSGLDPASAKTYLREEQRICFRHIRPRAGRERYSCCSCFYKWITSISRCFCW